MSLREPCLQKAMAKGVPVLGDIALFAEYVKAPVIGITGTNGKTTVTTLVTMMLQKGSRLFLEGILDCLLHLVVREQQRCWLELSSFQLESVENLLAAATILNYFDHLDRYRDYDEYKASKQRIYQRCQANGLPSRS